MSRSDVPWNAIVSESEQRDWMAQLNDDDMEFEWLKCQASAIYFLDQYTRIYDKVTKKWIPFRLWKAQAYALKLMILHRLANGLKARQEGFSWLAIGYHGLYKCLFQSISTVGFFSKRDDEAQHLLSDERLKGMYDRLPPFLQCQSVKKSDGHHFNLSNGSTVQAFPTTGGDSYSLTDAVLDEFDLVPDQNALLGAVLPAVGETGEITMISRVDKKRPGTPFKKTYQNAGVQIVGQRGENGQLVFEKRINSNGTRWAAIFMPWFAHPDRTVDWYQATSHEIYERTGALDELHEQYPATPDEALQAKTLDKRIPPQWLKRCYQPMKPIPVDQVPGAPSIPQLEIYVPPQPGRTYVIGADPAEGNPTSDPSTLSVGDKETGEECAVLMGQFQPSTLASYAATLSHYYNKAEVLCERNNHGGTFIQCMQDNDPTVQLIDGLDGKPGWVASSKGNALIYDNCADAFRDRRTILHSEKTYNQLASIDGSTLAAPSPLHDDRADAHALMLQAGRQAGPPAAGETVVVDSQAYHNEHRRKTFNHVLGKGATPWRRKRKRASLTH